MSPEKLVTKKYVDEKISKFVRSNKLSIRHNRRLCKLLANQIASRKHYEKVKLLERRKTGKKFWNKKRIKLERFLRQTKKTFKRLSLLSLKKIGNGKGKYLLRLNLNDCKRLENFLKKKHFNCCHRKNSPDK